MNKKTKHKQTELIFGIHPIIELLKAKKRRLLIIYTTKPTPKVWNQIQPLLPKGIQIQYVAREVLHKLAGTTDHQSVVGYATPFAFRKKFFEPEKQQFLLMLDGIQDPRNLGAIIRSAYCTGVQGIVLVQKRSAPLNAIAIKSSAGLAEHMPMYLVPSAPAAVQLLHKLNYHLYLSVLEGGVDVRNITFDEPLCLVIGSEGAGISREIHEAGQKVFLPQRTQDISYNASVAAGIFLFLISMQKGFIQ